MSFQTLYKELVGNINRESSQMESFSQLNYDWLDVIVDKLELRNVRVMRKSLSPLPQVVAAPEIADAPITADFDVGSFEESYSDQEDGSFSMRRVTFEGVESESDSDQFETVAKARIGADIWDTLDDIEQQVPMTAPLPRKRPSPEFDLFNDESEDEPGHAIRFVDSKDLRMSIDSTAAALLRDEQNESDNVAGMLSQLSTSAAQFREKWKGIVEEKNLESRSENQNTDQIPH